VIRARGLVVVSALLCLAVSDTGSAGADDGKESTVEAETGSAGFSLVLPAGFVDAPRIAAAAKQSATAVDGAAAVVARAWAHRSLGCYALLQTTTADKNTNIERLHHATSEAASARGIKVSDYKFAKTTSHFRFRQDTLRGATVTRSVATDATVRVGFASCFYQPRRAARCELLCSDILEQFEK